jgi:hypothetical protein
VDRKNSVREFQSPPNQEHQQQQDPTRRWLIRAAWLAGGLLVLSLLLWILGQAISSRSVSSWLDNVRHGQYTWWRLGGSLRLAAKNIAILTAVASAVTVAIILLYHKQWSGFGK